MQPATRSSNQPLGSSSGDWRHRFLRSHVPLALASALILVLFMTLPPFDPQAYPQSDMGSDNAFPARRGEGGPMSQGGDQAGSMGHSESQAGPTAGPTDHGGGQPGSTGHGANQTGRMGSDGMTESRGRSYFTQRF